MVPAQVRLSLLALLSALPVLASAWCSPADLALTRDGRTLYVACGTANRIEVWDTATKRLASKIAIPGPATGLAIHDTRLYATCANTLRVIDTANGRETGSVAVGHTPERPVLSSDGRTAYVPNRFSDDISVIDLQSLRELRRMKAAREPVAVAVMGSRLLPVNLLPAGRADAPHVAARIGDIEMPNGSAHLRAIATSPDGGLGVVTHLMARHYLPTTQLDRGWMETNALTVLDMKAGKRVGTVLLDDIDEGAANPWAVSWTPDGQTIIVSHAGTHELSIIDAPAMLDKLRSTKRDTAEDLSFMMGIRKRVKLAGNGPRAMALAGDRVYVGGYFSDTIEEVDLKTSSATLFARLSNESMSPVRRGEMLFNDASHCFQGWQSCASCHSPDARVDGLNWDLLNDGTGNPKNVKSLLLAHRTPPAMSHAVRENAEKAVRSGIRYILFTKLPEADENALDEFLKSLQPVPSPALVKGKLSTSAERGRQIFFDGKTGCANCHPSGLYTDLKGYDVGTRATTDTSGHFDTPTLVEIWRTAPYLHDGSAPALHDVILQNTKDRHGRTSHLNKKQIEDLVEYLRSL